MRRMNFRFILTGLLAMILAAGFFAWMVQIAPQSTDPVEMLKTAGTAAGVAGGIGFAILVLGLLGKGFPRRG